MSMHTYAVDDYGLLLSEDDLNRIGAKIIGKDFDLPWDVVERFNMAFYSEFNGEAFRVKDNGEADWDPAETFSCDCVYYFPASHYPNPFRAAYKDMDELVREFKSVFVNYLPPDFDFRGRVRHIIGTYCG